MKRYSKNGQNNFINLLWLAGFTDISPTSKIQIAKYLGVTVRCIEKWIVSDKPNKQAIKLLNQRQITLRKSTCWKDFRFSDDYLITPNGYKIKASELLAFGLYKQMM